jgi:tetraacyldisaccharide 4'-kinase
MARRGDAHRLIRWLWTSRRIDARAARTALLPLAGLWRAGTSLRNAAYDRGLLAVRELPLPSVGIGNLTVGGSGKTPMASWVASRYLDRGIVPGILLRGYGRDEVLLHRHATPDARVVANPDRLAGANEALAGGAAVLVLDDAFQRRDVRCDLHVALVAAETSRAVGWMLPAGPWREPLTAVRRAQVAVVTRKRASPDAARTLAAQLERLVDGPVGIVYLGVSRYVGMVSGKEHASATLAGRRVVAASAIADPTGFIAQTKATGAHVQAATWRDHHDFRDEDVAWLARAARKADFVVLTEKDAVKLRDRWPASIPEPLVAALELTWEAGEEAVTRRLDALVGPDP